MKINWKKLIIAIAIPLAVGGASAFITKDSMKLFESLNQPMLSPPPWLFPVVWTILYTFMGIASYLVYESDADSKEKVSSLMLYAIQLILNFIWPIVFFNKQLFLPAFMLLILLLIAVIITAFKFRNISSASFRLFVPYILWLIFAAYLNFSIYLLN